MNTIFKHFTMNTIFKYSTIICLLILTSCSNVSFNNSQPVHIENLKEIPERFQGVFEQKNDSTERYTVTPISINGDLINDADPVICVKNEGNYLFINTQLENKSWSFVCVKMIQSFNYEKIFIYDIVVDKKGLEELGVEYQITDININESEESYILSDINYNQLLSLINKFGVERELIRIN